MIFTTGHSKARPIRCSKRGFTLAEILIAMAIFASTVAIISGSGLFMAQWSVGVGNYLEMNQQGRIALEVMGRDLRMTSNVRTAAANRITVDVADRLNQTRTVDYFWNSRTGQLIRTEGGATFVVLDTVNQFEFIYFNAIGNQTTRAVDVKSVEISARLERQVRRTSNTNFLISARFTMRNKKIGT